MCLTDMDIEQNNIPQSRPGLAVSCLCVLFATGCATPPTENSATIAQQHRAYCAVESSHQTSMFTSPGVRDHLRFDAYLACIKRGLPETLRVEPSLQKSIVIGA